MYIYRSFLYWAKNDCSIVCKLVIKAVRNSLNAINVEHGYIYSSILAAKTKEVVL